MSRVCVAFDIYIGGVQCSIDRLTAACIVQRCPAGRVARLVALPFGTLFFFGLLCCIQVYIYIHKNVCTTTVYSTEMANGQCAGAADVVYTGLYSAVTLSNNT